MLIYTCNSLIIPPYVQHFKIVKEEGYIVNITNLKTGDIIKNYKDLCFLLEETISRGSSKIGSSYNWVRYIQYD